MEIYFAIAIARNHRPSILLNEKRDAENITSRNLEGGKYTTVFARLYHLLKHLLDETVLPTLYPFNDLLPDEALHRAVPFTGGDDGKDASRRNFPILCFNYLTGSLQNSI